MNLSGWIRSDLHGKRAKGKTAAALALAMRAIGAQVKTYVAQSIEGNGDSPLQALEQISDQVLLRKY